MISKVVSGVVTAVFVLTALYLTLQLPKEASGVSCGIDFVPFIVLGVMLLVGGLILARDTAALRRAGARTREKAILVPVQAACVAVAALFALSVVKVGLAVSVLVFIFANTAILETDFRKNWARNAAFSVFASALCYFMFAVILKMPTRGALLF
ncbi:tripartite tricarboxylate transporter TctB family protein [Oleispirillum naphthae]|uniref:tripartite tricarboxylate transporter TctB family protein n=1 Tax=Oleispirillum naphthae TaxID=2838853 RepID=UPI0030824A47